MHTLMFLPWCIGHRTLNLYRKQTTTHQSCAPIGQQTFQNRASLHQIKPMLNALPFHINWFSADLNILG